MPALQINTNLPRSSIPNDLCAHLAKLVAESLSKPVEYMCVHIIPDQLMSWADDTNEPCALISLMSIGRLGVEENKKHSKIIMDELNKLGIKSTRMYINFVDAKPADVGYNGSTFDGIL
jgi:phenylpyruvate tautomerase